MSLPRASAFRRGSIRRLFSAYVAASLVPLIALGAVLLLILHSEDDQRGRAQGASEARLLARTGISPLLGDQSMSDGLPAAQLQVLGRGVGRAIRSGQVVRVRVRDLEGKVVYADDGTGLGTVDDEALEAVHGRTITALTHLNSDEGDHGARGPRVVEAYTPLYDSGGTQLGVLEVYLPYAPIARDISRDEVTLAITLVTGLVVLWLALLGVSSSVMRRLRRQSADNAHLARHDALTGLPNRAEFATLAEQAAYGATSERPTAIAVIDLDRFKEVNDTLGHANGDQLLVALARRLADGLRDGDVLARLGGDEFGVILPALRSAGEVVEVLHRLRALIAEPIVIDGVPLVIEASVGFAASPDDGNDIERLLVRADVAMYVAKRQHLGVVRYQPTQEHFDAQALTLVAELASAIARDELVLHYQPKADVRSGHVSAVEALVRWQHPTRGLLFPDVFVPATEQTQLIEPLTGWVLTRALQDLAQLDPDGHLSMAVNISARSLTRPGFAHDVLAIVALVGADPRRLILEVTETALLADPQRAAATLTRLHEAGIRISIDDFGAGQTSLGHLSTLPISELKIDKQFVLAMTGDARNEAIVRSVIQLGHSLGFTVTAEGVETAGHLSTLTTAACDLVQGYHLARPMPLDRLRALLQTAPVVDGLPWSTAPERSTL